MPQKTERREVVLIDGVGRPRLHPVEVEDGVWPETVPYQHDGYMPGPFRTVRFHRCAGHELNGCPVYRLEHSGDPLIRPDYLLVSSIGPFHASQE